MNKFNSGAMRALVLSHVVLLTLSNTLVQYPFEVFGFHTTWGAFTYPAIFILTDLTVRILSVHEARKIIFRSMIPAFFISYGVSMMIEVLHTGQLNHLFSLQIMQLRIALASFLAYVIGQMLDILVFQRYRSNRSWWVAPMSSSVVGNLVDTVVFFSVAFYHCENAFLSQHWTEIAKVDLGFKILIGLIAFVPIYGFILNGFWRNRDDVYISD